MLSQSSKWTQLVANLVEKTRTSELKWSQVGLDSERASRRDAEPVDAMYETLIDNQPVRLVEYRYKGSDDEGATWYWAPAQRLEILDPHKSTSFVVPAREGLGDLREAIALRLTNAEALLAKLGVQ